MSDASVTADLGRRIDLGEIDPCGSRQAGRRSGVALTADGPVVGLADGTVSAFDGDGAERWTLDGAGSAITLVPFAGGVLVGERSARGGIRLLVDGVERWRHDASGEVGGPAKDTRFFLPMIVDAAVADDTAYFAARRYERRDGGRHFESSVYAFAPDGDVRWRYDADASPISVSIHDGGIAVAYNRCPAEHDDGLIVLDEDGETRWTWDPDRTATRRVGDVSSLGEDVVVTSHADYRGYRLADNGVDWQVDLGRPLSDGDGVYTYPNHVVAAESGIVFLTGNSFPKEGRETDERHPNEQTAFGYSPIGEKRWESDIGGISHGIATDGSRVLVPIAQHFRDRDPTVHGFRLLDTVEGPIESGAAEGVLTAAALDGERRALIEEPVRYHDDGTVRGRYSLWVA